MEPVFACAFVADVADDAAPDPSVTISAMTAHGELSTAVPLSRAGVADSGYRSQISFGC